MFQTYLNKILCFYAGMLKPVIIFFGKIFITGCNIPEYFMSVP